MAEKNSNIKTMSKKGKSALVLGASKDKLFAVGTFLISLRKTNPNFTDDIIVFYDEIFSPNKVAEEASVIFTKTRSPTLFSERGKTTILFCDVRPQNCSFERLEVPSIKTSNVFPISI